MSLGTKRTSLIYLAMSLIGGKPTPQSNAKPHELGPVVPGTFENAQDGVVVLIGLVAAAAKYFCTEHSSPLRNWLCAKGGS